MYEFLMGAALLVAQAQPAEPAIVITGPSPIVMPLDGRGDTSAYLALLRPSGLKPVNDAADLARLRGAAERGDVAAQYRLGLVLIYGAGADADQGRGASWLLGAAKGNHVGAHVFVGQLHKFGALVSEDRGFALLHFRAAARQGSRDGRYWLALGQLDPFAPTLGRQDVAEGISGMRALALAGDRSALSALGDAYRDGVRNRTTGERLLASDVGEALRWYERAAAAGDEKAMYVVGDLIIERHPAPKPYAKARRWFEAAARAGHENAEIRLGEMYELGIGGPPDHKKALAIYRKFESSGSVGQRWRLGRMYEFGRGVRRDFGRALTLYDGDASMMPQDEVHRVARLLEAGRGFSMDIAQARRFYCFAVDIPAAAYHGARMCEGGVGGDVDLREAYALYYVAAHDGHAGARDGLRRVAARLDAATRREVEEEMKGWLADRS